MLISVTSFLGESRIYSKIINAKISCEKYFSFEDESIIEIEKIPFNIKNPVKLKSNFQVMLHNSLLSLANLLVHLTDELP